MSVHSHFVVKFWTELHVADVSSDALTHPVKKKRHADWTFFLELVKSRHESQCMCS